jgi:intein-encoded DNA endonuclease-like protein
MKTTDKAYLAGFLDGDGSIHVRLKPNNTYRFGFQVAPSIVFYQSSKEIKHLNDIKDLLKIGYIRQRNDGIVEYIIGDNQGMVYLIKQIFPFLKLKKKQAKLLLKILSTKNSIKSAKDFYNLTKEIDAFEKLNYSKKRKHNSERVKDYLLEKGLLTP